MLLDEIMVWSAERFAKKLDSLGIILKFVTDAPSHKRVDKTNLV